MQNENFKMQTAKYLKFFNFELLILYFAIFNDSF